MTHNARDHSHSALSQDLVDVLQDYAAYVNHWARRKGFWPEGEERNLGELIALMHSELSEALEGVRHGNPPDEHCPEFTSLEIELADLLIRVLDMSGGMQLRLGEAVVAKMAYNEGRPHKHGKAF